MFESGGVYNFSYLWAWQFQKGEESGRKFRPVCLVLKRPGDESALFLFPLTSRMPEADRLSLNIPSDELRRCGLQPPCWIILDEFNRTLADRPFDFESLEPLGLFSAKFMKGMARRIKKGSKDQRIQPVPRS